MKNKITQSKLNRAAQIQMGEMVLVLVVVFILGVGALAFFLQRGEVSSQREFEEQQRLDLATTAKFISTIPELRYSLEGNQDLTVIDFERARQFEPLVASPLYRSVYRERLTGFKAEIIPVYPNASSYNSTLYAPPWDTPPFYNMLLFDFTDAQSAGRNSIPFNIPVLIYDPVTQQASYGLLVVTQVLP